MDRSKEMKVPDEQLEKELKDVTGGGWYESGRFYKSGDTPRYKVGDILGGEYRITAVNEGKGGIFWREFTYRVVYVSNPQQVYDDNAYESQLIQLEEQL